MTADVATLKKESQTLRDMVRQREGSGAAAAVKLEATA